MAINRKPRLHMLTGELIKVSKWIECNLDSPFANAIFEIEHEDDSVGIRDISDVILEADQKLYHMKFNRFHGGNNIRISGRISRIVDESLL